MTMTTELPIRRSPIEPGETAPDFTLMDQDRNEVSLKDLLARGGDVVLSFYPFAFTGVCSTEMKCYTQDAPKFTSKDATVVGISCDSFAANKAWSEQESITTPLLADLHRAVCKAYGFHWADMNVASRGTVVINPDGKVKWVSSREPGQAIENKNVLAELG